MFLVNVDKKQLKRLERPYIVSELVSELRGRSIYGAVVYWQYHHELTVLVHAKAVWLWMSEVTWMQSLLLCESATKVVQWNITYV